MARLLALLLASSLSVAFAQIKDYGNRTEGTAFHPNGLRDYELLGFYAYRGDFPLRDDVSLRVRFFPPEQNEPAFIEARELTVYKQYEMHPKDGSVSREAAGWREFKDWPVSAVLKPNGITADNLGIIVRLKTNAEYEENLAPAILLDARQPIPAPIAEYVLYLKFGKKLKNLDYQVDGISGYSRSYKYENPKAPKDPSVEAGIKTPIAFPAQPLPAGPVTIHIGGAYANDLTAPPLEIIYRFYHKPL